MAKIFCIANQKGGVGKTTTTVNLAAGLAKLGQRVLLVDLDPQGNATMGSGIDKRNLELSVYDVLLESASIQEAAVKADKCGYDVLSANRELAGAEVELVQLEKRDQRLRQGDPLLHPARASAQQGLAVKLQALQGFSHAAIHMPAVLRLDGGLQGIEVAFAPGEGLDHREHIAQASAHRVVHRGVGREVRLLRHAADAQALLHLQAAFIGLRPASEDAEQGGLARAIAANEAHALAHLQRELGTIKQGDVAKGEGGVEQSEAGHGRRLSMA